MPGYAGSGGCGWWWRRTIVTTPNVATVDLAQCPDAATGLIVTREQTYTSDHADLGGPRYRVYRVALARPAG